MARLYRALEAEGARIANAHTFLLQNGGMKDLDAAQLAFKRSTDPHLLMNPGKVAGLDDLPGGLSGTALEAAQLPASLAGRIEAVLFAWLALARDDRPLRPLASIRICLAEAGFNGSSRYKLTFRNRRFHAIRADLCARPVP